MCPTPTGWLRVARPFPFRFLRPPPANRVPRSCAGFARDGCPALGLISLNEPHSGCQVRQPLILLSRNEPIEGVPHSPWCSEGGQRGCEERWVKGRFI